MKHDYKWLKYADDGRNDPGVKLRLAMRYIQLMGGLQNALTLLQKYGKDGQ